jgi:uncharacterized small protein (DUF1192 family)
MNTLIERVRMLEKDHSPDGWPSIQMRDVSNLASTIEALQAEVERLKDQLSGMDALISKIQDERDAEVDKLKGAEPVAVANLIEAAEGLMSWQVKNVKVWNNSAYDLLSMRLKQYRKAAPQAPSFPFVPWSKEAEMIESWAAPQAPAYFEEQPDGTVIPVDPSEYAPQAPAPTGEGKKTLIELVAAHAACCWGDGANDMDHPNTGKARAALVAGIEALQAENADLETRWAEWKDSLNSVMEQRNALRAELDALKAQEPERNYLQDIAACIGVGGYNGANDEQLYERICDEFARATAPQAPAPKPLTDEQMGKLYRQSALQDQINGITEA